MLPAAILVLGFPLFSPPFPQEEPSPTLHREKTAEGERILVPPGLTLEDFIRQGGRILDRDYQWKQEVSSLIQFSLSFTGTRPVPIADFESFFEQMLLAHDFLVVPAPEDSPVPGRVFYLKGSDRLLLRSLARYHPVEEIDAYRARGILVTTSLPLRHLDAQRAVNNLRAFFPDQTIETITTVGDSVVVTGFASNVANVVTLLKASDVESAGEKAATDPEKPAPGEAAPSGAGRGGDLEAKLKSLEEAVESLRRAIRDLAAELRR